VGERAFALGCLKMMSVPVYRTDSYAIYAGGGDRVLTQDSGRRLNESEFKAELA